MFIKHRVYLSDNQLQKLRQAAKKNESISVEIDPQKQGNFDLYLTTRQINRLNKGKPCKLALSKTQIVRNGGFLLTALAIASALAGAATGIAKAVNEKKQQRSVLEEMKRHNLVMENKPATTGSGVYIPKRYYRSGEMSGYGKKVKKK